jgi:hypothetical protein
MITKDTAKNHTAVWAAVVTVGFSLMAPLASFAAPVNWGPAKQITNDTDVTTQGTLINAVNLGDSAAAPTTVNTVVFQGLAAPGFVFAGAPVSSGNFTFTPTDNVLGFFSGPNGSYGSSSAPFTGLSANYKTLLGSAAQTGAGAGESLTLSISGLVIGHAYVFEWWSNLSGTGDQLHTASPNLVALQDNTSGVEGGLGQYVVGTFFADATTETITFDGPGGALVNAAQLRDLGVIPEPSNAIIGLALAGIAGYSYLGRKRQLTANA